jgi:hypothetical protein
VERWQKLDQTSQRQYQAGDMSGYKATRSAMVRSCAQKVVSFSAVC